MEIKINDRKSAINLVERKGNMVKVVLDGKEIELDLVRIERGYYSAIFNNKCINVWLEPGNSIKHYSAFSGKYAYKIEIIDAESKYLQSRNLGGIQSDSGAILTPMPGKVVKILVKQGEKVTAGQTVIVISAMKMESEFKSPKDGTVKSVFVSEGDLVDGNQVVLEIE
ncbi:MAG: biotin/lipoyl-containing protein [Bacteroidales bacterium]